MTLTIIVATTAVPFPTYPAAAAFPYLQASESIEQQYPHLPLELCGPDDQDLACVQFTQFESIGVKSLKTGQTVEVQYMSPTGGRVIISLRAANGDYVLNVGIRIKWRSSTNQLILNNYTNGRWLQTYQDVKGFPFTSPPVPTRVTVQIKVEPNAFIFSANDVTLAKYAFRGSLTADKVEEIECFINDHNASFGGKLEKVTVSFK